MNRYIDRVREEYPDSRDFSSLYRKDFEVLSYLEILAIRSKNSQKVKKSEKSTD